MKCVTTAAPHRSRSGRYRRRCPIENETLVATLQEKEFKTLGRRARFDSEYLDRHALSAVRADLESWSAAFVDHLLSEAAQ